MTATSDDNDHVSGDGDSGDFGDHVDGDGGDNRSANRPAVDWELLRTEAARVAVNAYAPYSDFRVGAAALADDGRIITGCNVENASYGLTLCAECSLVSALHSNGGGRLLAVAIVSGSGRPCPPCGRCRQLLLEHGGADCLVDGDGTIKTVAELLPGGFEPDRLNEG